MSSSAPFMVIPPLGEIITFEQKNGETFRKAWMRMTELHRWYKPKMDLGVLIKIFYHGLLSMYQNALDVMVGETFSDYDAVKAYKILNGLLIFP